VVEVTRPDLFKYTSHCFVGVDLGQTFDPTAIAVIERQRAQRLPDTTSEPPPTEYHLRHLERLPLGTAYPAQVQYVAQLLRREPLVSRKVRIYVDQTGVGRAVFDMFRDAHIPGLYGVTITAGSEVKQQPDGWHVAKLELMSRVQASLHAKELRIYPDVPDAEVLTRELQDFRVKFSTAGNPIFGAREGAHDDIVLATALAMFGATQPEPVTDMNLRWAY
jgi:hypothetical protein